MALTDITEIPRRTMVLFFVVDTSGDMDGAKIGAVNTAIEEVIPAIKEISDTSPDAQIKVAVLEFSGVGARWINPNGPMELDDFHWLDLKAASTGVGDLGAAYKALNEKLSTKSFMEASASSFAPTIFLFSGGSPYGYEWQNELTELKQNNWFKAAIKLAVRVGDDASEYVLAEFTGTKEAVIALHNPYVLTKMIRFVSVCESQIDRADKQTKYSEFKEETTANQTDWW